MNNPEPEVRGGEQVYRERLLVSKGQRAETAPVSIHMIESAVFIQGFVGPDGVKTAVEGDIKRNKERGKDHILAEQVIIRRQRLYETSL